MSEELPDGVLDMMVENRFDGQEGEGREEDDAVHDGVAEAAELVASIFKEVRLEVGLEAEVRGLREAVRGRAMKGDP